MELYHAMNRGVDKRIIVLDNQDRARFVHDLWEFNDIHRTDNNLGRSLTMRDVGRPSCPSLIREPLVEIHGWCLMENHYHLLLIALVENGISLFLKKLNGGYAKYFNAKYERSGSLFQGNTKRKHIDSDAYFLHILHYIHLNPLDYLKGADEWRKRKLANPSDALSHLQNYRWSSFADYCEKVNFPSILTTSLFAPVFDNYTRTLTEHLQTMERLPEQYHLE